MLQVFKKHVVSVCSKYFICFQTYVSVIGPAVLTLISEWAFARMRSGWCARRTQAIYTGSSRRMPYVQWGGESCIVLHRGACSRGLQAGERGRSFQISRCVSVERLLVMSQIVYGFFLLSMVPVLPFYRCKGSVGLHACTTWCLSWEERSEASCSWWCTTIGGVTPVLRCCSDVSCRMWPCGRRSYDA
jgi:hypothetical protein